MAMTPRPQLSPKQAATIFKLLADENRIRMMLLLADRGEMNVTALGGEFAMSQPALSHHLALLRMAGLVGIRRQGKNNFYSVTSEAARDLLRAVKT
jgi:ArsR family transcriptional regulator